VAGRVQWHRAFGHTGPAGRCLLWWDRAGLARRGPGPGKPRPQV